MSTGGEHAHEPFEVPAGYVDPAGRPVDYAAIGRLLGAAFEGCRPCQDTGIMAAAADPPTAARLVELACVAMQNAYGGIPPSYLDPGEAAAADGMPSAAFASLAAAGVDGNNDTMFRVAAAMSLLERTAAVDTAVDLIIGGMIVAGPR